MKTTALITLSILAIALAAGCADDAGSGSNNGANNGNNGVNNGNNGVNNGNNGVNNGNNGVNNGNNGVNNGNNGANNGNNGNNGVNNGNNGQDAEIIECQEACGRVAACEELIEACGEDVASQFETDCRETACPDDANRAQILAVAALPCGTVVPLAIDGFGLGEACGGEGGGLADAYAAATDACEAACGAYAGDQCIADYPLEDCVAECDYAGFIPEFYPEITDDAAGVACIDAWIALEECLETASCEDVQLFFETEDLESDYPCKETDTAILDACTAFEGGE